MNICCAAIFILLWTCICQGHDYGKECASPWKQIGVGCYLVRQEKVSPDTAFALCDHLGAYLANLDTLQEALLLQYEIKQWKTGIHYIVGGRNINRYKPGGDWRWIKKGNMTKMSYFAFGKGQPDGSNGAPQDCMFFYKHDQYQLYDVPCYDSVFNGGYICEK